MPFRTSFNAASVPASVLLHEAAVADHIGGKDGGEAALGAFFGHVLPFRLKAAVQQIVVVLPRGVYRDGFPLRVIRYRGDPAASQPCPL